jgi:hypothetical protein
MRKMRNLIAILAIIAIAATGMAEAIVNPEEHLFNGEVTGYQITTGIQGSVFINNSTGMSLTFPWEEICSQNMANAEIENHTITFDHTWVIRDGREHVIPMEHVDSIGTWINHNGELILTPK